MNGLVQSLLYKHDPIVIKKFDEFKIESIFNSVIEQATDYELTNHYPSLTSSISKLKAVDFSFFQS